MLYEGNNNDICQTIRLALTGADVTNASVTCVVRDPHGALIATVAMPNVGEDEYRGTMTAAVVTGVKYMFDIRASNYTFRRVRYEVCQEPRG